MLQYIMKQRLWTTQQSQDYTSSAGDAMMKTHVYRSVYVNLMEICYIALCAEEFLPYTYFSLCTPHPQNSCACLRYCICKMLTLHSGGGSRGGGGGTTGGAGGLPRQYSIVRLRAQCTTGATSSKSGQEGSTAQLCRAT